MSRDTTIDETLSRLPVGTLVMNLDRAGFHNCFMKGVAPLTPERRFVGRARTLRCLPTRPDVVAARRKTPAGRRRTDWRWMAFRPGRCWSSTRAATGTLR